MAHFDVSLAAAHELLPACRLLFPDGGAEPCCDHLLTNASTSGLFVARGPAGPVEPACRRAGLDDCRLHAAILVQVLPGAVGVLALPRGDSVDARDAVTAGACAWLRARGVKVCQTFATASEGPGVIPLARHGFRHITQLVFLQREVEAPFDTLAPTLRWRSWTEHPTSDQLELLLATHESTLDCPELNDTRTADEILAGFQPNNIENRMWWSGLDESGTLVGVLLFLGGDDTALEISYLGLIPSARGRGLAGTLIRFAAHVASTAGYRSLHVSVDARNTPAMKLYTRHGFVEYDRREVWLASWPG